MCINGTIGFSINNESQFLNILLSNIVKITVIRVKMTD